MGEAKQMERPCPKCNKDMSMTPCCPECGIIPIAESSWRHIEQQRNVARLALVECVRIMKHESTTYKLDIISEANTAVVNAVSAIG